MGLNEQSDTSDNHEGTVAYSVQDSEETRYSMQGSSRTLLSPSWFHNAFRYSVVNEDDLEPDAPMQLPRMCRELDRRRRSLWIWRSVAALFAIILLVVEVKNYGILATADVTSSTVHDVHMQCGDTTRSAIARGCQFHPLSNRWLPGRCRIDRSEAAIASALNTDLEEKQPFKVWLDPAGKTEITDWSKLEIGTLVWTTQRHHISHCLNSLAQTAALLKFGEAGEMADESARDWEHTEYCLQSILTAASALEGWDQINSFFPIKAGACW